MFQREPEEGECTKRVQDEIENDGNRILTALCTSLWLGLNSDPRKWKQTSTKPQLEAPDKNVIP